MYPSRRGPRAAWQLLLAAVTAAAAASSWPEAAETTASTATTTAAAAATTAPPGWITPTYPLPSPFQSASLLLTTDDADGSCVASMRVSSSLRCARATTTVYPSTTTEDAAVDCLGCGRLAVSVRRGNCPLGGSGAGRRTTVTVSVRTTYRFVCAATATGGGEEAAVRRRR
ncbi:hypothetical protein VTK73DRAFT_2323 [Phialemonium thermophilum]|uniref:Uncharacterized protein n=1 Tax=Phialemonium thermophilum TaxID=223376 RepID=A0ABR3VSB6_9PEZI